MEEITDPNQLESGPNERALLGFRDEENDEVYTLVEEGPRDFALRNENGEVKRRIRSHKDNALGEARHWANENLD